MRIGWRVAFPAAVVEAGSLERKMALASSSASLVGLLVWVNLVNWNRELLEDSHGLVDQEIPA